jgi:hypothetical protein
MVKRVGFSYAIIKLPNLSVFSPYPYIDVMSSVLRLITDLASHPMLFVQYIDTRSGKECRDVAQNSLV